MLFLAAACANALRLMRTLPVRPRMVATDSAAEPLASSYQGPVKPLLSTLQGKALAYEASDVPTKAQVRAVVPDHCYRRQTFRSLGYLMQSLVTTAICAAAGCALIPLKLAALPLWVLYAVVTGTGHGT